MNALARRPVQIIVAVVVALALFGGGFAFGSSRAPATAATTTQLVLVGAGTRVVKTVETDVKLSDLKVGDTVTVAGTPDTASGTLSAQTIVVGGTNILGDILGGTQFPGGGGRGAGASGSPRPSPTR